MSAPSNISSSFKYNGQDYLINISNNPYDKSERKFRVSQVVDTKDIWKLDVKIKETQNDGKFKKTRYSIIANDKASPDSVNELYHIGIELAKVYRSKNWLNGVATVLLDGAASKHDKSEKRVIQGILKNGMVLHPKTDSNVSSAFNDAILNDESIPNFEGNLKCVPANNVYETQLLTDEIWDLVKNLPALKPEKAPEFIPASNPTAPTPEPITLDIPPYIPASDETEKDTVTLPETDKKIPVLRRNGEENPKPGILSKIGSAIRYIFCLEFLSAIYRTIKNWVSHEE